MGVSCHILNGWVGFGSPSSLGVESFSPQCFERCEQRFILPTMPWLLKKEEELHLCPCDCVCAIHIELGMRLPNECNLSIVMIEEETLPHLPGTKFVNHFPLNLHSQPFTCL